MVDNYTAEITQAIADLRRSDPRLHTAIYLLCQQVKHLQSIVEPIEAISTLEEEEAATPVDSPVVSFTFTSRTIRFAWNPVVGAILYEVRLGTNWDTATFQFRTSNLGADIDAKPVGTYTFLFKSINTGGLYSSSAYPVIVLIPPMGVVGLLPQVIDNNVLIDWVTPFSTFEIERYDVYRNGVYLTFVRNSFFTRVEPTSGTFTYKILAVDVAGNVSPDSSIALVVAQPPDYVLQDVRTSMFTGTLVNMVKTPGIATPNLIGPVDTAQTWEQHFVSNGWSNISDQINAGYPIYATPSYIAGTPDGYYEELFDYGVIFSAVIVTVNWSFNQFYSPALVQVTVKMSKSTDNINYSAYTTGAVQFLQNVRYLKIKLEFESPDRKSLMEVFNLKINLAVKREMDGGFATAFASDSSGTVVTFNKAFKDIEGITIAPMSVTTVIPIVDFVDIPNPTFFKVYIYDNSGIRITKDFRWDARGVI